MIAGQRIKPEPFFIDSGHGRQFAIVSRPAGTPRGGILFIPPFAEEMNKARRMTAITASSLAEKGWLVVRFDLSGCGDSEGDFADATWDAWLQDIDSWYGWLRERTSGPILLWSLRAGALLASDWLKRVRLSVPLLLWQPVANGQRYLNQFLRLRAAADMLDSAQSRGVVASLKADLADGTAVTVAGYRLDPEIAGPMAEAKLSLFDDYAGSASLVEIATTANATLSPALVALAERWRENGVDTRLSLIAGPPFWQTVEIETVPAAIATTVDEAHWLGA